MIIALDGPAGAGKSTVCRILAQKLCFIYLDTGAMYRALAWALMEGQDAERENSFSERLSRIPLNFSLHDNSLEISHRGRVLSEELRNQEISDAASRISRLEPVRNFLVAWQRKLAEQGDIVAEGRDTATVVFPRADFKVYLTATLRARAERRLAEYLAKGMEVTFEEMEHRIRERDEADSNRDLSPMRPAEGAFVLDTSNLTIKEVVDRLIIEAGPRLRGVRKTNHELSDC